MSRGLRVVLVLSLLANLAAVGVAGYYLHAHGIAVVEEKLGLKDPPRPPFVQLGHQRFGALPGAPVMFVGDSLAQNAPLGELLGNVADRGIGGQTVGDTAAWLDVTLDRPQLKRLVVWAGTNDVLLGYPAERTRRDMAALLGKVHAARPDVAVTVLGLPPLRAYSRQARAADQVLQADAVAAGATYLPVADRLTGAGMIDTDGVHVTPKGYVAIAPVLRQAAGQAAG